MAFEYDWENGVRREVADPDPYKPTYEYDWDKGERREIAGKGDDRDFLTKLTDFSKSTQNVVANLLKSGVDFVAPGSQAAQNVDQFIESNRKSESPYLQSLVKQRDQLVQEAKDRGDTGIQAWLGKTLEAPATLLLPEIGGNLATFILPGGAASMAGRGLAAARGATALEAAAAGGRAGLGTTTAMGGIIGAGGVRGGAYDAVMQAPEGQLQNENPEYRELLGSGMDPTEARRQLGQALTPRTAGSMAVGGLIGAVSGRLGAESTLLGAGRGVLRTTAVEAGTEALEEGVQQAATNFATQGVLPSTPLSQDVLLSGVQGAVIGGPAGAVAGLGGHARATPEAERDPSIGEVFAELDRAQSVDEVIATASAIMGEVNARPDPTQTNEEMIDGLPKEFIPADTPEDAVPYTSAADLDALLPEAPNGRNDVPPPVDGAVDLPAPELSPVAGVGPEPGGVAGDTAEPVRPVPGDQALAPDSAFNGDLAEGLNRVFLADEAPQGPVLLANQGFRADEIAALEAAGMATDGAMSLEQFSAWDAERGRRLDRAPAAQKTVTNEEKARGRENRAGFYERTADSLEETDPERAATLREQAAGMRSEAEALRGTPDQPRLNRVAKDTAEAPAAPRAPNPETKWMDRIGIPDGGTIRFKEEIPGQYVRAGETYTVTGSKSQVNVQSSTGSATQIPKATLARAALAGKIEVVGVQPAPSGGTAFSRVELGFKDVVKRTPELQEAAKELADGKIDGVEYDRRVNKYKPVEPYTAAPDPTPDTKIREALTSDKVEKVGVPSKTLQPGAKVGLRLDIPAYSNHGAWVVSVHEQGPGFAAGKAIGYEPVAAVKNPTFGVVEKAALNIAQGKPKATIAVIKGDWNPVTPQSAKSTAEMALKSKDWAQVGMDPERHAYFYDRKTMQPVISADEVVQVGPLVMAKNPVYGNKSDFAFSRDDPTTAPRDTKGKYTRVSIEQRVERVKFHEAQLRRTWKNAPPVEVIETIDDAPAAVARAAKSGGGEAEGFIHEGKIYLVADQLKSAAHVRKVMLHESVGHHGLRGTFGDNLDDVLDRVAAIYPDRVAREMARDPYLQDVAKSDSVLARRKAAEEVLAYWAQEKPELGIVRRAIGVVRNVMRRMGFSVPMSDTDIIQNVLLPARRFVERGGRGKAAAGGLAFERGDAESKPGFDMEHKDAKRAVTKTASLSPEERAAALKSVAGKPGVNGKMVNDAIAAAINTKKQFPKSDGWAPLELVGLTVERNEDESIKSVDAKWKAIPYRYNIPPGAKRAPSSHDREWVDKVADKFTGLVKDIYKRAEAGDKNAQVIVAQASWYEGVTAVLRRHFGAQGDLFSDLLGATSPNTPVPTNWKFAIDILERFSKGEFRQEMTDFVKFLDAGGNVNKYPAEAKIRQISKKLGEPGKLYGMNSDKAMKALADMWRIIEAGSAPKARNFALNLIGQSNMATIDVWAARMLRRAANSIKGTDLPRIPPPAESAVDGVWNASVTEVTGAFGFGAAVMDRSSQQLAEAGITASPPSLQAVAWFAEKELWGQNKWTTAAGEGGSFEQMIEKDPFERYVAGWSIQKGEMRPESGEVSTAQARVMRMMAGDPSIVAARVVPTVGLYGGVEESSFDTEWTVKKKDHNPNMIAAEIARLAAENTQYDMFVSRVLDENEDHPNARPGAEMYFKSKRDLDAVRPILDKFIAKNQDGFTMAVDPRASKDGDRYIGVRIQYVPEITMRWDTEARERLLAPGGIERELQSQTDILHDIIEEVSAMPGVAFAETFLYDTTVVGKENYDGFIAAAAERATGKAGAALGSGTSVRDRIEEADRRYRAAEGGTGDGDVSVPGSGAQDRGVAFSRAPQTDSAAFKKWFGDSKVVDPAGKPLVMFHGTNKSQQGGAFTMFDTVGEHGLFGQGAYFTDDSAVASSYTSKGRGDSPSVYPVYLSIKNPLDMDARAGDFWAKAFPDVDFEGYKPAGENPTNESFYRQVEQSFMDEEMVKWEATEAIREALEVAGFDGITHIGGGRAKSSGVSHRVYIAFAPEQIKSATGNNGYFDPADPRIAFSRQDFTVDEPSRMDDVVRTMQDRFVDLKKVMRAIQAAGRRLDDKWNPYLQEELYHNRAAHQTNQFLAKELKPLMQEMAMAKIKPADFDKFLHARHAEERNLAMEKKNPTMANNQALSGMSTQDANAHLASLSAADRARMDALAAKVDSIKRKTQQILVASGLEKQSTINAWNRAYKNYVPLQREEVDVLEHGQGTGQGFNIRGSSAKKAIGSNRKVVDILANVAMQRERAIVRAEKNRVSQGLWGLAAQVVNEDFWKAVDPTKVKKWTGDDLKALGIPPHLATVFETPQVREEGTDGLVRWVTDTRIRTAPNVVTMRVNGEDRFVIMSAKSERAVRLAAAMKNLDTDQLGNFLSGASKVSRVFASINTQYNPIFGIVNLLRDFQGSMINLSSTPLAGKQASVAANMVGALSIYRDIRRARNGKPPTGTAWSKLYEEFQKEGGPTGFRQMFTDSTARAKQIEADIREMTAGGPKKAWNGVFNWLSDYNEWLENATRLAVYKTGKDNGLTNQQAASVAKNISVNFNRKGNVTSQVGALYAFFNASMQGSARLKEAIFVEGSWKPTAAGRKILAGGAILGVAQAMALAAAGFDDDEPQDFVRERNIVIPLGNGKIATIPMPLGLHVIPGVTRLMTEFALSGGKDPAKKLEKLFSLFAEAFNPIGNAGMSIQTIAPTAIDPLVALSENKDYTGKNIAKEDFNSLSPTPGHTRAKDTASDFGKGLSWVLNAMTGGTDYKPGVVSPTPDQIDYLVGQLTGGVGRELLKFNQTGRSAYTGEELPPHKMPLVGRFYGDVKSQSAQAGKFYDNLIELHKHEAEIKGRAEDKKEFRSYMEQNPTWKALPLAKAAEKEVGDLRKVKRVLVERKAPKEEIQKIDARMTALMTRLNDEVRRLEAQ